MCFPHITQKVFDVIEAIMLLWSIIADISLWIVYKFHLCHFQINTNPILNMI